MHTTMDPADMKMVGVPKKWLKKRERRIKCNKNRLENEKLRQNTQHLNYNSFKKNLLKNHFRWAMFTFHWVRSSLLTGHALSASYEGWNVIHFRVRKWFAIFSNWIRTNFQWKCMIKESTPNKENYTRIYLSTKQQQQQETHQRQTTTKDWSEKFSFEFFFRENGKSQEFYVKPHKRTTHTHNTYHVCTWWMKGNIMEIIAINVMAFTIIRK